MIAINAIGDNVDEGDNAADDANFFALEHNKWSAPRRTSYEIPRNCAAVPPKIDLAPCQGSTCFPPHGVSLTHMRNSPDQVIPLAHMYKSSLTQVH